MNLAHHWNDLEANEIQFADQFIQKKYNGRAVIITGCGFPDVQTRVLLNRYLPLRLLINASI